MEHTSDQDDQLNKPNDAEQPKTDNMDTKMDSMEDEDMDTPEPKPAPVTPPTPNPTPAPAPTPTPTPAQGWPETAPAPAQVQYVVAQQSLEGLSGWLMFWLVIFALNGIGQIAMFFTSLSSGFGNAGEIVTAIFSPIVGAGCIATVAFIAMRKKLAVKLAMATLVVMSLNSIINLIVDGQESKIGVLIGAIVANLIFTGLCILYFFTSKRVKQTLIK